MSETIDLEQLFRRWRNGDQQAGQLMAQRFSDWYYAICATRLGDRDGRVPLERTCRRFQDEIVQLTDSNNLVGWAHGILKEEFGSKNGMLAKKDQPSAITGNRSPSDLLKKAGEFLPTHQITLIALAYNETHTMHALRKHADIHGGFPLAVLQARYALKRVLHDEFNVKFTEIPAHPNLDLSPLPLYECGRLADESEDEAFEHWMLSDLVVCRDLVEFSSFALALRDGALMVPGNIDPDEVTDPKALLPKLDSGIAERGRTPPARRPTSRLVIAVACGVAVGVLFFILFLSL